MWYFVVSERDIAWESNNEILRGRNENILLLKCVIFELMEMINKQKLVNSLQKLPDSFSFEELMDTVTLLQKIEKGVQQSERGETFTTEQAKQKLNKWLK